MKYWKIQSDINEIVSSEQFENLTETLSERTKFCKILPLSVRYDMTKYHLLLIHLYIEVTFRALPKVVTYERGTECRNMTVRLI